DAAAPVHGRARRAVRHPAVHAERPDRGRGRQRRGPQDRRRGQRPGPGGAPDLHPKARGPMTAPSAAARLARQQERLEGAMKAAAAEVTAALPAMGAEEVTALLEAAVPITVKGPARFLEELAGHMASHPGALPSGSSLCPPVLLRLAHVLHD